MKQFLKHAKNKKKHLAIGLIIVVIAVGIGAYFLINRNDKPTLAEPTITYSTNNPDESKANADNYNWRGAPDEPKKIKISKIGVDAFVQKAGVDQNNAVAVPNNVHLTGWFEKSVKPGNDGYSVIAGHVSGRTTNGVFENLKNLTKDDKFTVELGNGTILNYKVIKTVSVPEKDAAGYLFSQDPKVKSQVNLITCGGAFDKATEKYADRVIVWGELQK